MNTTSETITGHVRYVHNPHPLLQYTEGAPVIINGEANLQNLIQRISPAPWLLDVDGEIMGAPTHHENGTELREVLNIQTPHEDYTGYPSGEAPESNYNPNATLIVEARNALSHLLQHIETLQQYEALATWLKTHHPTIYTEWENNLPL